MSHPTQPHGGTLRELLLPLADAEVEKRASVGYPSVTLTPRQLCDLELLLDGGFSPLDGFLDEPAYVRVVEEMRLPDGTLWPMPITLDVAADVASSLHLGDRVALRSEEGVLHAVLTVRSVYRPDRKQEA